jgi:alpha-tubulin suppressor-like RCC1 family protein
MNATIIENSNGNLEIYSGKSKIFEANSKTGVVNFMNVPTATDNGITKQLITTECKDAFITPPITYITKSGHNSLAIIINGKLYTTAGNSSYYPNATTGRGVNSTIGQYGLDNLKRVVFPENTPIQKVGGFVHTFAYALMTNGNLYTWGNNTNGQCGLGHTNPVAMPTLAATGVVDVYDHPSNSGYDINKNRLFIKKDDGYIYGTGDNTNGALGLGDTNNRSSFTQITSLGTNVISLWNMGADLGCTIVQTSDYKILVAGYNGYGQLGTGDTNNQTSFVDVTDAWGGGSNKLLKKVIGGFGYYIPSTAYQNSSLGMLLDDGTNTIFRTCGDNINGEIGNGATSGSVSTPYTPDLGIGRIADIAGIGSENTIHVLKEDGTLYAFGYSAYGQAGVGKFSNIGTPTIATTGVTALLADGITSHYYGYVTQGAILKSDGLYMCGLNDGCYCGIGNVPGSIASFTKTLLPADFTVKLLGSYCTVSYGRIYVAVSTDNLIYTWGYNGQYGIYDVYGPNVLTPVNVNTPRG